MVTERPVARMTLRQLLTQAGKLTRDASDMATKSFQDRLHDLHDLSRPTRRKTQYPSVVSFNNAVQRFDETSKALLALMASLDEHLQAIRDQANRARSERK